jgi:hypothetical protein
MKADAKTGVVNLAGSDDGLRLQLRAAGANTTYHS